MPGPALGVPPAVSDCDEPQACSVVAEGVAHLEPVVVVVGFGDSGCGPTAVKAGNCGPGGILQLHHKDVGVAPFEDFLDPLRHLHIRRCVEAALAETGRDQVDGLFPYFQPIPRSQGVVSRMAAPITTIAHIAHIEAGTPG